MNHLTDGRLGITEMQQHTGTTNVDDAIVYGHPVVDTTSGMMMGQTNSDSHAFYSVPYAEPPVGELR